MAHLGVEVEAVGNVPARAEADGVAGRAGKLVVRVAAVGVDIVDAGLQGAGAGLEGQVFQYPVVRRQLDPVSVGLFGVDGVGLGQA
ncbi:hypothetical protein D3C79_876340 [compost metagenome]